MKTEFVSLQKNELKSDEVWWSIYQACFPASERESKEVILKSIDGNHGFAFAIKLNNKTIGIATTQLLVNTSSIFLVYLALDPFHRRQGIGAEFLSFILEHGKIHLSKIGMNAKGLVWEVEKPDPVLPEKENSTRLKRIEFFKKLGAIQIDTLYVQPPVDGKNIIEMNLMYLPSSNQSSFDSLTPKSLIHSIYFEKYFRINNIDSTILNELLNRLG